MKRTIALAAGLLAVIGLTGPTEAGDTITVGKAQAFGFTFVPVEIASDVGIWKKHGFDEVKVVAFNGDARMQQGLISGDVDFGLGSGPAMAFTVRGAPQKAVAAYAAGPRNICLAVGYNSNLTKLSDFKGKKLGTSTAGSLTDWLVKRQGVVSGWGPDGVQSIPMGGLEPRLAAIKTNQIDGMVIGVEVGYQLEQKKEAKCVYNYGDLVSDFITHVIFARTVHIDQKPDMVQRFVNGWFETFEFMRKNKAKTVEVAGRVLRQTNEIMARVYDEEMSMLTKDGTFDPKAVAVLKDSFLEMGMLESRPSDDQLFTTKFVPAKF
jgi:ABC-type nitrate/sulfonate/bicarbonate transport system substrate-binding protein